MVDIYRVEAFEIKKNEIDNWDFLEVCVCNGNEPIDKGDSILVDGYHAKKGNYEEFGGKWICDPYDCPNVDGYYLGIESCNNERKCSSLRAEWNSHTWNCKIIVLKDNIKVRGFQGFVIDKSETGNWDFFEVCCKDRWCNTIDPIDAGDKIIVNCFHRKKGNYEEFGGLWVSDNGEIYLDIKGSDKKEEIEKIRKEWSRRNGCCLKQLSIKNTVP